jgi:DNA-binding XRE family transcriptional regulator
MTKKEFMKEREALGFTRIQLAEKLGLSRQTIFNYEYGHYEIPRAIVLAMQALKLQPK